MRLSVICFTATGARLALRLLKGLTQQGDFVLAYGTEKLVSQMESSQLIPLEGSLNQWAGEQFQRSDGLIFIGAAGIAVRAIAPFVKDKAKDPAVVVLDELGRFSISLLSGHLGGANELAKRAAEITGGQAVITTATDLHGIFAVDIFAKNQGLVITNLKEAGAISASLLKGERAGFYCDFPLEGELPGELLWQSPGVHNLWVTVKEASEKVPKGALRLVPPLVTLGIGCRRGASSEAIEAAVKAMLHTANLSLRAVRGCASIDLKKDEPGLLAFADQWEIPLFTYSAKRLSRVSGEFSASSFVKEVTGVDNVCERAALALAGEWGGGRLIVKKEVHQGVTIAAALCDWKVRI